MCLQFSCPKKLNFQNCICALLLYTQISKLFDTKTKFAITISPYCIYFVYRALEFIYVFMETVVQGEEDLVKCANKAYDASLRKYHGWIVRGVFSVSALYHNHHSFHE